MYEEYHEEMQRNYDMAMAPTVGTEACIKYWLMKIDGVKSVEFDSPETGVADIVIGVSPFMTSDGEDIMIAVTNFRLGDVGPLGVHYKITVSRWMWWIKHLLGIK